MEQIIKFGISNYLQLCMEAGFSQIQSHIYMYMYMFVCTPPRLSYLRDRKTK